ncbi:hypothetical protein [Sinorhizobium medicae]
MTMIVAGAFADCAFIAADRKRADMLTGKDAGSHPKIVEINASVFASKAGYGPDADDIWEPVLTHPDRERLRVEEAAQLVETSGREVYKRCISLFAGMPNPGLHVLIAGAGRETDYRVHAINFGNRQSVGHSGPIVFAFGGMRSDTNEHVKELLMSSLQKSGSFHFVQLDEFVGEVMDLGVEWAPNFVGYPADLRVVVIGDDPFSCTIEPGRTNDRHLRRRVL